MSARYTVDDFDYSLPPELIAQHPARDARRQPSASRRRRSAGRPPLHRLAKRPCGRRPAGVQRHAGHQRAARGRKPTGGNVELLHRAHRRPRHGGRPVALEPSAARRYDDPAGGGRGRDCRSPATTRLYAVRFEGTGALDAWLEQHGELPLAAVHHARARCHATPAAIRPCTRATRARSPRRPPACISTQPMFDALRRASASRARSSRCTSAPAPSRR